MARRRLVAVRPRLEPRPAGAPRVADESESGVGGAAAAAPEWGQRRAREVHGQQEREERLRWRPVGSSSGHAAAGAAAVSERAGNVGDAAGCARSGACGSRWRLQRGGAHVQRPRPAQRAAAAASSVGAGAAVPPLRRRGPGRCRLLVLARLGGAAAAARGLSAGAASRAAGCQFHVQRALQLVAEAREVHVRAAAAAAVRVGERSAPHNNSCLGNARKASPLQSVRS